MEFNTVDGFQGREVDILLLSTVRASGSTNSSSIGFVADVRRMNVALTRAKFSLWIVGNAKTLQQNLHWVALIENAKERKLFISVSKPYDSIFGKSLPSSTKNRRSKLNSHSSDRPKLDEKVRYGSNAKEVPKDRTDILDGKVDQHSRVSVSSPNDDSSSREVAMKHSKDRGLAKRRQPLPSFEYEGNKFQNQKKYLEGADNALQNLQRETDSSTKELIRNAKEVLRSSKHCTSNTLCQQSSSMTSSVEERCRLSGKVPIKKANAALKYSKPVTSRKLSTQSSSVVSSSIEGSNKVNDNSLTKKAKEEWRSSELDTSNKLSQQNSLTLVSPEGSHRLSAKVLAKKSKERQKYSDSGKFGQHSSSDRIKDPNDCQPPNLEHATNMLNVKAKGKRMLSEQGPSSRLIQSSNLSSALENKPSSETDDSRSIAGDAPRRRRFSEQDPSSRLIQSSSTLSSALENRALSVTDDGRPREGDAPKNLMETRKRQRDDVDALLSSALIPTKKSGGLSKPRSVKRL